MAMMITMTAMSIPNPIKINFKPRFLLFSFFFIFPIKKRIIPMMKSNRQMKNVKTTIAPTINGATEPELQQIAGISSKLIVTT